MDAVREKIRIQIESWKRKRLALKKRAREVELRKAGYSRKDALIIVSREFEDG